MTNKSKSTGFVIVLGTTLGAAFGVLAGHIGIWLATGFAIGMLLGASFRRKEAQCPECAQVHRAHEIRSKQLEARSFQNKGVHHAITRACFHISPGQPE